MKSFCEVASIAGDPARAAMLHALIDGRALTAGELARSAGVTPQTASGHLSRLVVSGLVGVRKEGRHRYHHLASPRVARMMEGIMDVAADRPVASRVVTTGPKDPALREARVCFDHFAGRLGVALADALVAAECLELSDEGGLVTEKGVALLKRAGIETERRVTASGKVSKRVACRPCLDWSERRLHVGGAIGAAICRHAFEAGWASRMDGTRAVRVTRLGLDALRRHFDLAL